MPLSTRALRDGADEFMGRCNVFTNQSMQQVRSFARSGMNYTRRQIHAFNETCRGRKNGTSDSQCWSQATSEQNIGMTNSRKRQILTKQFSGKCCASKGKFAFFSFLMRLQKKKMLKYLNTPSVLPLVEGLLLTYYLIVTNKMCSFIVFLHP